MKRKRAIIFSFLLAVPLSAFASGQVMINGVVVANGNDVVISNGRIIVDGNDVTGKAAKTLNVEVHGNVASLTVDAANAVSVSGSVGNIKTQSGDVRSGDVSGSVQTMSGDITCGKVGGGVSSMSGDVSVK